LDDLKKACAFVTAQVAGGKQRQVAARPSFLKKRSKKPLVVLTSARPGTLGPEGQKFFDYFFQKKNRFLPLVFASADISALPGQLCAFLKKEPKNFCDSWLSLTVNAVGGS
jgi:hypothetical protein